nr:EamA family transporter [Chryseosolibacter indicus]
MLLGMFSFSLGNVYYSKTKFSLSADSINAWQIVIGGLGLSPLLLVNRGDAYLIPDLNFWLNLLWLSVVVSIISVRLWFYLLKKDPVHASQWLYLAPVFGYILSFFVLGEAITGYAIAGTVVVIAGLILSKKSVRKINEGVTKK